MSELQTKVITVSGVTEKLASNGNPFYKINDEKNLVYNLWKNKKDGTESVAYQCMSAISPFIGKTIKIAFNEQEVQGGERNYTSRTIVSLSLDTNQQGATQTINKPVAQLEDKKWEDINFGKCKHQFLIEIFKYLNSQEILPNSQAKEAEALAEEWATMSMRRINKEPNVATTDRGYQNVDEVYSHPQEEELNVKNIPF